MIKQGESLFIPFLKGQGVPDAHYKARTYKSVDACRKALKRDFDKVEIVEYVPVVHGLWDEVEGYDGDCHYQCSLCGEEWTLNDGTPLENNMNYCPRCGARMGGKEGRNEPVHP